jgi:hypothetical protein
VLCGAPQAKMQQFLSMIDKSRLLAPNLRRMTLQVYSSTQPENIVARYACACALCCAAGRQAGSVACLLLLLTTRTAVR